MCLILFAFQHHPQYPLIIAANRDEFYQRPATPAHFWEDAPRVFAGRDLQAGGTWMGITHDGRFAAVTNYRSPQHPPANAISRGTLCQEFLSSEIDPKTFLQKIDRQKERYAGFNLLVGNKDALFYYSNRKPGIQQLAPGIYGLSNGLLDDPWPKVKKGKTALTVQLQQDFMPQDILEILLDDTTAIDEDLPATGIDYEMEKLLSSRFIFSEGYGTRCSTVLIIDQQNHWQWHSQHFAEQGSAGPVESESFPEPEPPLKTATKAT